MFSKKNKSNGFTLIELLIVIIIIGILAAIAFVAYSGAQNKAKKSEAQSTVSEAKNKLAEYNAAKGYYPASLGDFTTWLSSAEGGNNNNFVKKLSNPDGDAATSDAYITYSATDSSGAACDNGAAGGTMCANYTLTADASHWNADASENITVTN